MNISSHKAVAYRILFLSCVAYLLIPFHRVSPAVMATDIMLDLAISAPSMGFLASTFFIVYGALQLPGGMLIDTFGSRRILPIFLTIAGLGAFLFSISSSLLPLILARALMGLGMCVVFLSGLKLISRWFAPHQYPIVSGVFLGMGGIGLVLASQPLAWLCEILGWRTTFLFCAIFSGIMAMALYAWVRDCPPVDNAAACPKPTSKEQWTHTVAALKLIVRHRDFWYATIWIFCAFNMHMSFAGLWGGPFLMDVHNLSRIEAGSILNITGLGVLIGGPLCGYLSEHVLRSRKKVMIIYSFFSTLLFIILYMAGEHLSYTQLYMWFFVLALLGIGGVSVAFTTMQDLFGASVTATASGLLNTLPSLGVILFQPVTGFILEMSGRTATGFTVEAYSNAAIIFIAAGLLGVFAGCRLKDPVRLSRGSALR